MENIIDDAKDKQSRKWQLTFNNPVEHGFTHDAIIEKLMLFSPAYFCMADEISESGTYHTHVFFYCSSAVRESTIRSRFPKVHFERVRGSVMENRDYITKTGKWAETDKAETSVEGTFFEYGEIPDERTSKEPDTALLVEAIKEGASNLEIVERFPKMALQLQRVDYLRNSIASDRYATEMRSLTVSYWYGASGSGKSTAIFQCHEPQTICRITNYRGGNVFYDAYNSSAHDVLVFEEYRSQIPIGDMLNVLDRFPLRLPARYSDRQAAYHFVYLTSNIPLSEQYPGIDPETRRALYRRIHSVVEFHADYTTTDLTHIYKGDF